MVKNSLDKILKQVSKQKSVIAKDSSPIYDDCDVIRAKIREFMKTYKQNNKQFARLIGANPTMVGRFLKKRGIDVGASNGIYFQAYDFFERLRKATKKRKRSREKKLKTKELASSLLSNQDL